VTIVLRNYWMYERQAGRASQTQSDLSQNRWPLFPGPAGGTRLTMRR